MFPSNSVWFWCPANADSISIIQRKSDKHYGLLINVTPTLKQIMFGDYDNKDEKWQIIQELPQDKVLKCLMLSIDQIQSLAHGESRLSEERKHIFWVDGGIRRIDIESNLEEWKRRMSLNFPGWETEEW